jgi:hypothetical protein
MNGVAWRYPRRFLHCRGRVSDSSSGTSYPQRGTLQLSASEPWMIYSRRAVESPSMLKSPQYTFCPSVEPPPSPPPPPDFRTPVLASFPSLDGWKTLLKEAKIPRRAAPAAVHDRKHGQTLSAKSGTTVIIGARRTGTLNNPRPVLYTFVGR